MDRAGRVDEGSPLVEVAEGTRSDPVAGHADRRHAARVALALVLLAPFALVAAFVVLIEQRQDAGAALATATGPTTPAGSGGPGGSAVAPPPPSSSSTTAASVVVPSGVPDVTQPVSWQQQFLACVRRTESRNSYTAVNASGAGGAYQIMPVTWNATAQRIGRTDLVGVAPQYASPSSQDLVAAALLEWQGPSAWPDGCG